MPALLHFNVLELSGEVPSEFRLLSPGTNPYRKEGMDRPGSILFDDKSAAELMKRFADSGRDKMVIDYDHSTFNNALEKKVAAGWFKPAIRNGELWATEVKWTPTASKHIADGEFRFYSPTVELDDDGRAMGLRPVALTNDPALCNLRPLIAASYKENKMKLVLKALDLAEDADEATALSAVHRIGGLKAQVLALTGKANVDEALGALTAMKLQAERAVELTAQLEKERADKAAAELVSLLDDAVKDGRITAAKRPEFEQLATVAGISGLKTCLSVLTKAPAPAIQPAVDVPAPNSGLTKSQLEVIKATGLSAEQFSAHQAKYRAAVAQNEGE